jgi:hypothetical protein
MSGKSPGKRRRPNKDPTAFKDLTDDPATVATHAQPFEIDDSADAYVCLYTPSDPHVAQGCWGRIPRLIPQSLTFDRQENEGEVISAKRIKPNPGDKLKQRQSDINVLNPAQYVLSSVDWGIWFL